jgi:hypothetical protein
MLQTALITSMDQGHKGENLQVLTAVSFGSFVVSTGQRASNTPVSLFFRTLSHAKYRPFIAM